MTSNLAPFEGNRSVSKVLNSSENVSFLDSLVVVNSTKGNHFLQKVTHLHFIKAIKMAYGFYY